MKAKILNAYMISALVLALFLLVVLAAFEIFPALSGNDDLIVTQQANLQLARNEFIAKDVLILAYRPITNHSQAINELQTILPMLQQVQAGLRNGDSTLGLPANPPDNVKIALTATQSDYLSITIALKNILLHPDSTTVDPVQLSIILQHERSYTTSMYQVVLLLQGNAEAQKIQLLIIKISLAGAVGLVVILKYLLLTREVVTSSIAKETNV